MAHLQSHQHDTRTDAELLQLFQESRKLQYAGILLERYSLLLMGVCMKYLKDEEKARDAVQQIFLKVLNDLWKYRIENFSSWLYQVARNHCFMQFRQEKRHFVPAEKFDISTEDETRDLEDLMLKEIHLQRLSSALTSLNEPQQKCIRLFYLEEKSYREIAKSTGYSIMEVKSHIQNGRRNLKIQMEKTGNKDENS